MPMMKKGPLLMWLLLRVWLLLGPHVLLLLRVWLRLVLIRLLGLRWLLGVRLRLI